MAREMLGTFGLDQSNMRNVPPQTTLNENNSLFSKCLIKQFVIMTKIHKFNLLKVDYCTRLETKRRKSKS